MNKEPIASLLFGFGIVVLSLALIRWPHKFQELNLKTMRGKKGLFVDAWRSQATVWTIRICGIGGAVLGSIAIAQYFSH